MYTLVIVKCCPFYEASTQAIKTFTFPTKPLHTLASAT